MAIVPHYSGIYAIRNTTNNHLYIGASHHVRDRMMSHVRRLLSGKHVNPRIQADFNLCGEDAFEWGLVTRCDDQRYLLLYEGFALRHASSLFPLYNAVIPDCAVIKSAKKRAEITKGLATIRYEPAFNMQKYTPWCTPIDPTREKLERFLNAK